MPATRTVPPNGPDQHPSHTITMVPSQFWTERRRQQLVQAFVDGFSWKEMAEAFGRTESSMKIQLLVIGGLEVHASRAQFVCSCSICEAQIDIGGFVLLDDQGTPSHLGCTWKKYVGYIPRSRR